ncbi:MAG: hypothetical protein R3C14_14050 [Caldilineaceae bacterium]
MQSTRQLFPRWALWLSGAVTLLAGALLVLAIVLGVRAGQQQLEIKRRQQIGVALQHALEYHNAGEWDAARNAYAEVLILDPNNSAALNGLAYIRQFEGSVPTGENAAVATAPPATLPVPSTPLAVTPVATSAAVASGNTDDGAALLAKAQLAFNAGRWAEAVELLVDLRRQQPAYQSAQVQELLFDAYINLATEKDNQDKLEEAVALFDQAIALRPDATEIRQERQLIAEYLDVLTYTGADWAQTVRILRNLYQQEADYRDVKDRLHEALLAYGKAQAEAEEWCDAADLLTEAIDIAITPGIIAQRDQYRVACQEGAVAKPTTDATPTAGAATPGAAEKATTPVAAAVSGGPTRGRILYSAVDEITGQSQIMEQDVGSGAAATLLYENGRQPALRQDGARLVFHNTRNDMAGLSAWDPATDLLLRFTHYVEDSLPSWSPQGNQLVFASNREGDRIWRIYSTWADDNSNAVSLSIGDAPAWHPTQDLVVFRGCDDTGNRCGLWTMDSQGGNRQPLTTVPADNRPTWSPDGRTVVFMSDGRDDNFDIYRIDAAGGPVVRLSDSLAIDGLPTVSPDGRWVAFVSNRDGRWKLWAVPIGGGAPVVIAPVVGVLPNWLEHDLQWVP